jgi:ketol-acid reductoisomerase
MTQNTIHVVGYGSQGSAWAQCLKAAGWNVLVYLASSTSGSYQKAKSENFETRLLDELPKQILQTDRTHWIAMLCPDSSIVPIYQQWIATSPAKVRLILAHGYAIYSGELQFDKPFHQATLLAPKAIGPKLLENFHAHFPGHHSLVAAFNSPADSQSELIQIAQGLGFDPKNLVPATFDQETIGDLISEQGLLCGGVFNLLNWTMEAMTRAGVPDALIQEECLTELELIAGMVRSRGPGKTFQAISQNAQAGTIAMGKILEKAGVKEKLLEQAEQIENRSFVKYFQSGDWIPLAEELKNKLNSWDQRFRNHRKEKS